MRKVILILIGAAILTASLISPVLAEENERLAVFSAPITAMNRHELYVNGRKFFFAHNVKVFLDRDGGKEISLKSLAAIGKVDEATLYIHGNKVRKLVVLQVTQ